MPSYLLIVMIVFGYLCWKAVVDAQERRQEKRLELLERAIDSGNLDRATLEGISRVIYNKPFEPHIQGVRFLFIGWMLMFLGAAGVVFSMASNNWVFDGIEVGVSLACIIIGFALTTFPFAARDLEARNPDRAESLR